GRFANGIVPGVGRPERLGGWLRGKLHKIPGPGLLFRCTGIGDPERSATDNHPTFSARRPWDVGDTDVYLPTCLLGTADIATQRGNAVERQHRFTADKRGVPARTVRPAIFAKTLGDASILQLLEEVQPVYPRCVVKDQLRSPRVAAIIRAG